MRQQRTNTGCLGLETVVAQQRIQPDDAVRSTAQLRRGTGQVAMLVAVQAVGHQQHGRVRAEQAASPTVVELVQAGCDARATFPVVHLP